MWCCVLFGCLRIHSSLSLLLSLSLYPSSCVRVCMFCDLSTSNCTHAIHSVIWRARQIIIHSKSKQIEKEKHWKSHETRKIALVVRSFVTLRKSLKYDSPFSPSITFASVYFTHFVLSWAALIFVLLFLLFIHLFFASCVFAYLVVVHYICFRALFLVVWMNCANKILI